MLRASKDTASTPRFRRATTPFRRSPLATGLALAVALGSLTATPQSAAAVYRWVNENGQVVYSDHKPAAHSAPQVVEVKQARRREHASAPSRERREHASAPSRERSYAQHIEPLPSEGTQTSPSLLGSASVSIQADRSGLYFTEGMINGKNVRFLVDTGAAFIAMNRDHAESLGLKIPHDVSPSQVKTASGYASIVSITLEEVRVGNIVLKNVEAGITDNEHPDVILLGMSFLAAMDMHRKGELLTLVAN